MLQIFIFLNNFFVIRVQIIRNAIHVSLSYLCCASLIRNRSQIAWRLTTELGIVISRVTWWSRAGPNLDAWVRPRLGYG